LDCKAPVRKIIGQSTVDGPGNRTSVFLQGCNIKCAYCHNPETQPKHPFETSRLMTVHEVLDEVRKGIPFIRGITVSGGECMLYPEFLLQLFRGAKELGLSCLIDSNGTISFSNFPKLLDICDGVMLDVKAWDVNVYHKLTGDVSNNIVKDNLKYLSHQKKLEEVRIVCLEDGIVDVKGTIDGIYNTLVPYHKDFRLKLIRFRPQGVKGVLSNKLATSEKAMNAWKDYADKLGFRQ